MTAYEYLAKFNAAGSSLLLPDEKAVQMINHSPMYFISNKGRVFSAARKTVIELKQAIRSKAVAEKESSGDNSKKASVCLRLKGNKQKVFFVHKLVAEYFPIDTFVPNGYTGNTVIHHINGYNEQRPQESNHADNLLKTTQSIHRLIHTMPIDASDEKLYDWDRKLMKALKGNYKIIFVYKSIDSDECGITELTPQELIDMFKRSEQYHNKHE